MAETVIASRDAGQQDPSMASARNRRLDIQGLRAVAVLMVVAFHAGLPVPGGFVGVDVFFVISGFVITAMLMREWRATGRIRLGRFYLRRFKRLTPALAVTVAVVMLASSLLLSPLAGTQQIAAQTGLGAILLAANVVISRTTGDYFDGPAEANPLLNTWSLSVEEQFYLVFPAVLLVGWAWGRRARRPGIIAVALVLFIGILSFIPAVAASVGIELARLPESLVGFYGPLTRAWEFAVGALLALVGAGKALSSRWALPLSLIGAGMLAASLWLISSTTPFPGAWTLLPVIGTLLLLATGSGDNIVARGFSAAPMIAIGDRSYSIYLWHWPFIVFAQLLWPGSSLALLAAAVLSLIPAYASYRWIEEPIRALSYERGVLYVRLVVATVVPPLALAGALGFAAQHDFWNESVRTYQASIRPSHAGFATGCDHNAWLKAKDCTWNEVAGGRPIYLVGDSHADHFSEALIGAAQSASRPMVGLSENGCAYLPVSLSRPAMGREWESQCSDYQGHTEGFLATADRGLVVIANSYWWFGEPSDVAVGAPGESPSYASEVKLRALSSGLSRAVLSLKHAGYSVLLVQAVPQWGERDSPSTWASCSMLKLWTVGCSRTMPMTEARDRQGVVTDLVADVARETGAALLDVSSELCPDGTCASVAAGGLVRYRDGSHLTVEQSKALTRTFEASIQAAG